MIRSADQQRRQPDPDPEDGMPDQPLDPPRPRVRGARRRHPRAEAGLEDEPAGPQRDDPEDPGRQEVRRGEPAGAHDQGEDHAVDEADRIMDRPAERLLMGVGRRLSDGVYIYCKHALC